MRNYCPKRTSGAPPHTLSIQYRMICLVLLRLYFEILSKVCAIAFKEYVIYGDLVYKYGAMDFISYGR